MPVSVVDIRNTLLHCLTDRHGQAGPAQWIVGRRCILHGTYALWRHGSCLREGSQFDAMSWIFQHHAADIIPSAVQITAYLLLSTLCFELALAG